MLIRKVLSVVLALVVCSVSLLGLVSCKAQRTPVEYGESGKLLEFTYGFGSYHSGYWSYEIYWVVDESQNKEQLFFKAKGSNGVNLNVLSQVEEYVLDDIYLLIEQNDIFSWNGFSGYNPDVLDGYSFGIDCTFENLMLSAGAYHEFPDNYDVGHDALAGYLEALAKKYGAVKLGKNALEDITYFSISFPEGFEVTIKTSVYGEIGTFRLEFKHGEIRESYTEKDLDKKELTNYLNYLVDTYNKFKDEPEPEYTRERTYIELYLYGDMRDMFYNVKIDKTKNPAKYNEIISKTLAVVGKPKNYLESDVARTQEYKSTFYQRIFLFYDPDGLGAVVIDLPEQRVYVDGKVYVASRETMLEFYDQVVERGAPKYEFPFLRDSSLYIGNMFIGKEPSPQDIFEKLAAEGYTWFAGSKGSSGNYSLYGGKGEQPLSWQSARARIQKLVNESKEVG